MFRMIFNNISVRTRTTIYEGENTAKAINNISFCKITIIVLLPGQFQTKIKARLKRRIAIWRLFSAEIHMEFIWEKNWQFKFNNLHNMRLVRNPILDNMKICEPIQPSL